MSGNENNAAENFAKKLTAAVAASAPKTASRGRTLVRGNSKLSALESVAASSGLLGRAKSATRSKSVGAVSAKKEKTEEQKKANAAKRAAEAAKKLAPLKALFLEVGEDKKEPTMTNLDRYETLRKFAPELSAANTVRKLLNIVPKKTGRTEEEKKANAAIEAMLRKSKLGRSSARLRDLFKNAKAKNATRKNNAILNELAALERSPEKEKSEKELAEEVLKDEIYAELKALTPSGKDVNSAHAAQLFRLRNSGFKLIAKDYLLLREVLKNVEKASAADASNAEKILARLEKQKVKLDVCAQCELLKAFNI